jgi:hypothetical protein
MLPNPSSGRQTGGLSALKVSSVLPRALCCHGDRATPTFGFAKQLVWARYVSTTLNWPFLFCFGLFSQAN